MSRFTTDFISSIAFGYNCNSLKYPKNEFRKHGKISNDFGKMFVLLSFYAPGLLKYFPVPSKRRKVERFFIDLFRKMVNHRKRDSVTRNDFLNLLIQLMDRGKLDDDEVEKRETQPSQKSNKTCKFLII